MLKHLVALIVVCFAAQAHADYVSVGKAKNFKSAKAKCKGGSLVTSGEFVKLLDSGLFTEIGSVQSKETQNYLAWVADAEKFGPDHLTSVRSSSAEEADVYSLSGILEMSRATLKNGKASPFLKTAAKKVIEDLEDGVKVVCRK